MLVAPTPVSSISYIVPATFAAWEAQGPDDAENICTMYASFASDKSESVSELLREVSMIKYKVEVTL